MNKTTIAIVICAVMALAGLATANDFAPLESIEILEEEYDRPKSGVGKNGPCVALPLPALEADFCTRQISRGLPDNTDPIITLFPGIYRGARQ